MVIFLFYLKDVVLHSNGYFMAHISREKGYNSLHTHAERTLSMHSFFFFFVPFVFIILFTQQRENHLYNTFVTCCKQSSVVVVVVVVRVSFENESYLEPLQRRLAKFR